VISQAVLKRNGVHVGPRKTCQVGHNILRTSRSLRPTGQVRICCDCSVMDDSCKARDRAGGAAGVGEVERQKRAGESTSQPPLCLRTFFLKSVNDP
jgi:hypothetical protein